MKRRTFTVLAAILMIAVLVLPAAAVGPIVPNPDAVADRSVVIEALYERANGTTSRTPKSSGTPTPPPGAGPPGSSSDAGTAISTAKSP